jgi:hypothetical protein
MLSAFDIGVGITTGGASGIAAPVLDWDDETDDATPDFAVDFDETVVVAGNTVTVEIYSDVGLATLVDTVEHVLDAGDIAAGTIDMAGSALDDGTYYVRAKVTGSSWSNTETVTIDAAPVITSASSANCAENAALAHALTADQTVTWSIVGGADSARFEISGSTLRWAGNGTKDFEAPDDADTNNAYVVTVRATDAGLNTTDQTITITVTDISENVTATFVASANSTTDAASYTFAGISLGDAIDIVVGALARASGNNITSITSIKVHAPDVATDPTGTTLTQVAQVTNFASNTCVAGLFSGARPSGHATGDIVVTLAGSSTALRAAIAVYKKTAHSGSPVTGTSTAAAPTATLAVPMGGAVVGIACQSGGATSTTPTNLTEDLDTNVEAGMQYTAGSSNAAVGSTAFTFTFTATAANPAGVFSAWGV